MCPGAEISGRGCKPLWWASSQRWALLVDKHIDTKRPTIPLGAKCPMALPCEQRCRSCPYVPFVPQDPLGSGRAFRHIPLGTAKSRSRWSPSPAPALRVWPRGQRVHGKRAELQGCVLTRAQLRDLRHHRSCRTRPPPTAPLSKKQPEGSALTPSKADPCGDTCPASRAAQRESKRRNGTGRFGTPEGFSTTRETTTCIMRLSRLSKMWVNEVGQAVALGGSSYSGRGFFCSEVATRVLLLPFGTLPCAPC